jgi:cysteine desulfurase family protein
MIYLDNAATTYPKPEEVYKALDDANRNLAFNMGRGTYQASKRVYEIAWDTRKKLADLVNTSANNVVFSSSATESLNQIIYGIDFSKGDNVYVTPFEHNSIIRPLYHLKEKYELNIYIIPFDKKTWEVNTEKLTHMFEQRKPKAVFVSHISNVTGYILPYEQIFELSNKYDSINVLDCAQSFGVLNPKDTRNINYIVFAGHKSLYASFGIAGFIKLKNDNLNCMKFGGTGSDTLNHEMPLDLPYKYEAGSPNAVAIVGLNKSLEWLSKNDVYQHEKGLTDYLVSKLKSLGNICLKIPEQKSILGIVSFTMEGYNSQDIGEILSNDYDICVRTGFHCSPFVHEFINSIENNGTVRISIGFFNNITEIDKLYKALELL